MKPREVVVFPLVLAGSLGLAALLLAPRAAERREAQASASAPASIEEPLPPAPPPAPTPKEKPPPPSYVQVSPESATACGPGMVLVDGIYCPFVGHRCLKYREDVKDVCERFGPEVLCEGRLERRRFCVDVYEYPNMEGVKPAVMADWNEARRACEVEGKRLCTVEEWEFACEGPGMWPYPYGAERDAEACNIDRPVEPPDFDAFSDPRRIADEVDRLDRRVASGEMHRCVSPFGVHDMTGNVDEWVDNTQGKRLEAPYRSSLKGGSWGPIRARCRPITSTHNEWFSFYQVGFRCCADPKDGGRAGPAPTGKRPRLGRMNLPPRKVPERSKPAPESP
ncbi:formylglycine-generating enzyme family protein [Polyangium jinanense]|uniref:SUMF1/EgtB/PvdO family nonheme iron enzyme n=1 Tax=Polyangium jinanense TaxID=2829994 RepID=A0A9X4AW68_9BACT|nr:SUMF1/EgtB/PvdO family nonheme iron enzyme [Polyangium jinanense]MDC3961148.1 SUMF1/EgtB/PvdO family nonheme iron enzyme [Polyangium jinanense]MDC3986451.1 SUMF1/EgtB/PvdO family nonheme iron enzyme [Polyangium jinanense]